MLLNIKQQLSVERIEVLDNSISDEYDSFGSYETRIHVFCNWATQDAIEDWLIENKILCYTFTKHDCIIIFTQPKQATRILLTWR